jgi:TP901 family phage tail tape measure protein
MAGYNLGTAKGTIELVYKDGAAKQAKGDLDGLGKNAGSLGKGFGVAGAAIAVGFAAAVNTAANFEKQVSAIGAVSGATETELDQLRELALRLGSETSFSASEAAMAIEELAKAGIPLPAIMGGAADAAVALAAAGAISLPEAAAISSNAMNQFGLTAAELPGVVDLIAGAANASAIDVGDFGYSLSQVGAVANMAGLDFRDTAVAIALMGNAGIKGSDAGTSLKSMLMNLQPTTKAATNQMQELGLITEDGANQFYDAEGNIKSLSEISGLLSNSMKGLSEETKIAALETMFGSDAIRAASIMANNGSAGFDAMAASMGKVKAADVAKARLDNFSGAVEQMKGALETAAIQVGSVLLPALQSIVKSITGVINKFSSLSPNVRKVIVAVVAVSGVLLGIAGIALMVVSGIGAVSGAFAAGAAVLGTIFAPAATAAGAALSFLLSPITLVVIAIIAVIAILVICYKKFDGFRAVVDNVGRAIKSGLVAALNFLKPIFDAVVSGAQKLLSTLISVGKGIWTSIQPAIQGLVAQIKSFAAVAAPVAKAIGDKMSQAFSAVGGIINGAIMPAFKKFMGFLGSVVIPIIAKVIGFIMSTVMPILMKVAGFFIGVLLSSVISGIQGVIQAIQGAFQIIVGIFGLFKNILTGNWRGAWNSLVTILKGVWNLIIGSIKVYFAVGMVKIFKLGFTLLKGVFTAGWALLKGLFGSGVKALGGTAKGGFNLILKVIRGAMRLIWNVIKGAWNLIVTIVRGYIKIYTTIVRTAFNFVKTIIANVLKSVLNIVKGSFSRVVTTVRGELTNARNAVTAAWTAIRARFASGLAAIRSAVLNGFNKVVSIAKSAGSRLTNTVRSFITRAVDAVKAFPGKVARGLGNLGSRLYQAGRDLIQGFINGIKDMAGAAIGAAGDIAIGAVDKVKGFLRIGSPSKVMAEIGNWTAEGFANGLKEMIPKVETAAKITAEIAPKTMSQPITASLAPAKSRYQPIAANSAPVIGTQIINPAKGMSEEEVGRQTAIRLGASLRTKSIPIPAPAGGYK